MRATTCECQPRLDHLGPGRFFHHVVLNRPMPQLTWMCGRRRRFSFHDPLEPHTAGEDLVGLIRKTVISASQNGVIHRSSRAKKSTYHGQAPSTGRLALYGEVEYQLNGIPFHLTTTFFEPGLGKK